METLQRQSIAQALRENFTAYPESYPINDGSPSEDAISSVVDWVEMNYENDESEDKGRISEWFEIAINNYLDFFSDKFEHETEMGENEAFVRELVKFLRTK